jgi:glycine hydroxymethyltransferase
MYAGPRLALLDPWHLYVSRPHPAAVRDVLDLVAKHDDWRSRRTINLIPSENVTSEQVRGILASDLGHRYTLPWGKEWHGYRVENSYRGTRYLDEIEALGEGLAQEVFHARHATLKPMSGHLAGMLLLASVCSRGDRILVLDSRVGGYDGYMPGYMPTMLGLEADVLPFDESEWTIDARQAADRIDSVKPKLVLVGSSFIVFPHNVRALRKACDAAGAVLAYDGSHVLGLIAGGVFQDPLREGADVLFGSTHKSFFGPQGGLVVTDREDLFARIVETFTWRVADNAHWNRIAATAQALLETKAFGKEYAKQVVRNAQALGRELEKRDLPVKFAHRGYTKSHQVHLLETGLMKRWGTNPNDWSVALERSDIIVDSVGRIGTNEVTRMGAKEAHMETLADLMAQAMKGDVREGVAALRKELKLSYVFPR